MDSNTFRTSVLEYVLKRINDEYHPLSAEEIDALARLTEAVF